MASSPKSCAGGQVDALVREDDHVAAPLARDRVAGVGDHLDRHHAARAECEHLKRRRRDDDAARGQRGGAVVVVAVRDGAVRRVLRVQAVAAVERR